MNGAMWNPGMVAFGWSSTAAGINSSADSTTHYLAILKDEIRTSNGPGAYWHGFPLRCLLECEPIKILKIWSAD